MADQENPPQLTGAVSGNGQLPARRAANGSVVHTGTTNGRVAKRDSDEIVAEIERTRQDLAKTIDALADRVSPASNVRRLREQAAEQLGKPEVQAAAVAVALALAGIAIYRLWGRRR